MHTLTKKEGNKQVTHHFHHVTETDGSTKHVYLGTDRKKAEDRLTRLKVERIRSSNKLIKQIEDVQVRLNKLGESGKSYEDRVAELRKQMKKERYTEQVFDQVGPGYPGMRFFTVVVIIAALAGLGYFAYAQPAITGAAITTVKEVSGKKSFQLIGGLILGIAALSLFTYTTEYRFMHRHDRYKPPK